MAIQEIKGKMVSLLKSQHLMVTQSIKMVNMFKKEKQKLIILQKICQSDKQDALQNRWI